MMITMMFVKEEGIGLIHMKKSTLLKLFKADSEHFEL
jgi:hypothetical protein